MHSEFPPSLPSPDDGTNSLGPSLSDEAIYEIAAQIRSAVRRRGTGEIVGDDRQLPWADEERVIAAAAVLELLEGLPGT